MTDAATSTKKNCPINRIKNERMVISDLGLEKLKAYQYKSGGYTPLDNLLNAKWWTPVVELVPLSVAPNMITLFGLAWVIISFFVLTYFLPKLEGEAPWWAYLFAGLCLFFYQTLDAIDGKQARRTGSSSPLGQLFDHGCDSVSTTFLTLATAASCNLGSSWLTIALMYSVMIPFFLAQWQEYHTHIMSTNIGVIGVTEGQMASILVHIVAAVLGPQSLYTPIIFGIGLLPIGLYANFAVNVALSAAPMYTVFTKAKDAGRAFLELVPLMMLVAFGFFWALDESEAAIFSRHPRLVGGLLGLLFTHLTNQMILCAMTHMTYPVMQWVLLPLPFVFAQSYFGLSPRHDGVVLGVYLGVVFMESSRFAIQLINEICACLGINCLSLEKRNERHE
eukprot:CFRG2226T1